MKTFAAALLVASAIALPAFAAEDHAPKHGGVVVETKAGDMELVAKPELIVIHVSDHGKPMKEQIEKLKLPPVGLVASLTFTDQHYKSIADFIAPQGKFGLIDDPAEFNVAAFKGKAKLRIGEETVANYIPGLGTAYTLGSAAATAASPGPPATVHLSSQSVEDLARTMRGTPLQVKPPAAPAPPPKTHPPANE